MTRTISSKAKLAAALQVTAVVLPSEGMVRTAEVLAVVRIGKTALYDAVNRGVIDPPYRYGNRSLWDVNLHVRRLLDAIRDGSAHAPVKRVRPVNRHERRRGLTEAAVRTAVDKREKREQSAAASRGGAPPP
jgi:hypothetical protein